MHYLWVLCNVPDMALASKIAQTLVERKLAACVNILSPCQSLYHWQGVVESRQETPLFIKTTDACYDKLAHCIGQMHPDDNPEIIALPIANGLPAYLAWVGETCDS